ncbi:ligase-associated DNA damage response endonuclease PdeM [soil metagenome]
MNPSCTDAAAAALPVVSLPSPPMSAPAPRAPTPIDPAIMPLALDAGGEHVELWPQRAVFWPRERTLMVADMHLGKVGTFVAAGLPVRADLCERAAESDLARLGALIARTGATRLAILGDLLHARAGRSPEILARFAHWRTSTDHGGGANIDILLIRGNHDDRAGDPPCDWCVQCVDEPFTLGPFALRHYPKGYQKRLTERGPRAPKTPPSVNADSDHAFWFAGHVHPAVTIGIGGDRAAGPCFHICRGGMILPAFGAFTGGESVRPCADDQVFVCGPRRVFRLPL